MGFYQIRYPYNARRYAARALNEIILRHTCWRHGVRYSTTWSMSDPPGHRERPHRRSGRLPIQLHATCRPPGSGLCISLRPVAASQVTARQVIWSTANCALWECAPDKLSQQVMVDLTTLLRPSECIPSHILFIGGRPELGFTNPAANRLASSARCFARLGVAGRVWSNTLAAPHKPSEELGTHSFNRSALPLEGAALCTIPCLTPLPAYRSLFQNFVR